MDAALRRAVYIYAEHVVVFHLRDLSVKVAGEHASPADTWGGSHTSDHEPDGQGPGTTSSAREAAAGTRTGA
jgi:hypothetical protein